MSLDLLDNISYTLIWVISLTPSFGQYLLHPNFCCQDLDVARRRDVSLVQEERFF